MAAKKNTKLTVILPPDIDKKLARVAQANRRSRSEMVRVMILDAFQELQDRKVDRV